MNTKILAAAIGVLLGCALALADEPAGGEVPEVETDAIFEEIIRSLPREARQQVDSAKAAGAASESTPVSSQTQELTTERSRERQRALEELPEELRRQVEKAIGEIEAATERRQLQFKERVKERSGQK